MIRILENLFPDIYVSSVYELPLEELRKKGIRGLVFDIDNTIAPYDVADADEQLVELFKMLKQKGFRLCILSNNNKKRVRRFNQKLRALAVHKAGKPGTKKLRKAMKKMGTDPATTAIVGDQIFTDMWCGHRAGLLCVMTAPICDRDQFATWIKRGLERQLMKLYFYRHKQPN
jgi:HAD superfamily phosphatase (TIGR01668 family)